MLWKERDFSWSSMYRGESNGRWVWQIIFENTNEYCMSDGYKMNVQPNIE